MTVEFIDEFDREWLIVNAIRQSFGIARKGTISYSEAIALVNAIDPGLLRPDSPLSNTYEKEAVKLYQERAEARSLLEKREITPIEVIDADIEQLRKELGTASQVQNQALNSEIERLNRVRTQLDMSSWTEDKAIHRDADAPDRELPISGKGQGYKIFRVSDDRFFRIRVLHPDSLEAITGVDLVYETYYDKVEETRITHLVRIAVLQYKMWDGKTLYSSQSTNLVGQMEKMHKSFCELGICDEPKTSEGNERYRLPYCCAFLRPTDKKQTKDAWQVTHAWHIPICAALERIENTENGNKILRSKQIRSCALTQDTFQELYNSNMLGSRFIRTSRLSTLYGKIGLFNDIDRVILHAQEY